MEQHRGSWGYEMVEEEEWGAIEAAMRLLEACQTAPAEPRGATSLGREEARGAAGESEAEGLQEAEEAAHAAAVYRAQQWQQRLVAAGCHPAEADRRGQKIVADAAAARARLHAAQTLRDAVALPLPSEELSPRVQPQWVGGTRAALSWDLERAVALPLPGEEPSLGATPQQPEGHADGGQQPASTAAPPCSGAHAAAAGENRGEDWAERLRGRGYDAAAAEAAGRKVAADASEARGRLRAAEAADAGGGGEAALPPPETDAPSAAKPASTATPSTRCLPQSFRAEPPGSSGGEEPDRPALRFKGRVIYADSAPEVERCCRELLRCAPLTCGFDIEWRATFARGVPPRPAALLQLCFPRADPPPGEEGAFAQEAAAQGGRELICLLLHVKHAGVTPALRDVLTSQEIFLTGVGARGDAHKMQIDHGVEAAAVVELMDEVAGRRMPALRSYSLASLCEAFFGAELSKVKSVRCSNWEVRPLSVPQQLYAATDAFASLLVHWAIRGQPPLVNRVDTVATAPAFACSTEAVPVATSAEVTAEDVALVRQIFSSEAGPNCAPGGSGGRPAGGTRLPPCKLEALHSFMERRMTIDAIAQERRVKRGTVEGYLADAIHAGHAYDWPRLQLPAAVWRAVLDACRGGAGGGFAPDREAATARDAPTGDALADAAVLAGRGADGLQGVLSRRGIGLRALKEALPEGTSYGQIMLCLAHMTRLAAASDVGM
mmetsp:Transcript_8460/g.21717  ORF Transcript_8460/g.21717 Transcript_8460/m.21717 type:complete len:721 (-) Transcript_8460:31-2193(-)|eukprot:jgi/Tetstr1/437500/TSEL_026179.t1